MYPGHLHLSAGWGGAATVASSHYPTPLRLGSKLPSLTAPPLKGRGLLSLYKIREHSPL
jgi:hypothetical protein